MDRPEETAEYWHPYPHEDLALRVAVLHGQRRELQEARIESEIQAVRRAISAAFIAGHGIEVGAGARPFPIPDGVRCFYGDVRDEGELATYFGTGNVSFTGRLDAQTLDGVPLASLDFAISAHVIEHLFDPFGSIRATIERLKPGGIFLLVVPELTSTWDRRRPPTTVEHMVADLRDGGESTRLQAYLEHFQYVAPELGAAVPEDEIDRRAPRDHGHRPRHPRARLACRRFSRDARLHRAPLRLRDRGAGFIRQREPVRASSLGRSHVYRTNGSVSTSSKQAMNRGPLRQREADS